jgi:hypothetical protein
MKIRSATPDDAEAIAGLLPRVRRQKELHATVGEPQAPRVPHDALS